MVRRIALQHRHRVFQRNVEAPLAGLGALAAVSAPAQLTRIEIGPSCFSILPTKSHIGFLADAGEAIVAPSVCATGFRQAPSDWGFSIWAGPARDVVERTSRQA